MEPSMSFNWSIVTALRESEMQIVNRQLWETREKNSSTTQPVVELIYFLSLSQYIIKFENISYTELIYI